MKPAVRDCSFARANGSNTANRPAFPRAYRKLSGTAIPEDGESSDQQRGGCHRDTRCRNRLRHGEQRAQQSSVVGFAQMTEIGTDSVCGVLAPVPIRRRSKPALPAFPLAWTMVAARITGRIKERVHIGPIFAMADDKTVARQRPFVIDFGRGEVIRTLDPLHPMQVRYQAALRPDRATIIPSGVIGSSPAGVEFRAAPGEFRRHRAHVARIEVRRSSSTVKAAVQRRAARLSLPNRDDDARH